MLIAVPIEASFAGNRRPDASNRTQGILPTPGESWIWTAGISLRIDTVQFGGVDQRRQNGPSLASGIGSREHQISSMKINRPAEILF
jgi:hypothetical protein